MKLSDLDQTNTRFTSQIPGLEKGAVLLNSYSSSEYFDRMREKVFRKTWLWTGKRVDEIPNPGDYFLEETDITNTSVIIVRGLDGKLRGFHNTCLHRGTQLVFDTYGSVKGKFTCIYHGWAYALNGKNVLVTEREMFFDVEKMHKDLIPVAVDDWAGFIFFNLDPNPTESLQEHIGRELIDRFDDYPFETTTVQLSYYADLDCSWPVLRDSQVEGYHLKYLHNRSAPDFMVCLEAPHRHAYDFKLFGKHGYGSFYGNREKMAADLSTVAPILSMASKVGDNLATDVTKKRDISEWPKSINPQKTKDWFFDVLYIYPNFHIVFLGYEKYIAHKLMPGKHFDKSSWNARFFSPPLKLDSLVGQWANEYFRYEIRDLWREDGNTTLGAQRSINSGVFTQMYLQDQEVLIRHAENVLNQAVWG